LGVRQAPKASAYGILALGGRIGYEVLGGRPHTRVYKQDRRMVGWPRGPAAAGWPLDVGGEKPHSLVGGCICGGECNVVTYLVRGFRV